MMSIYKCTRLGDINLAADRILLIIDSNSIKNNSALYIGARCNKAIHRPVDLDRRRPWTRRNYAVRWAFFYSLPHLFTLSWCVNCQRELMRLWEPCRSHFLHTTLLSKTMFAFVYPARAVTPLPMLGKTSPSLSELNFNFAATIIVAWQVHVVLMC